MEPKAAAVPIRCKLMHYGVVKRLIVISNAVLAQSRPTSVIPRMFYCRFMTQAFGVGLGIGLPVTG